MANIYQINLANIKLLSRYFKIKKICTDFFFSYIFFSLGKDLNYSFTYVKFNFM